jgi:hypothetical protein
MKVVISLDRVWVGEGTWNDDCTISNCQALLGRNQDESDEAYEELAHELSELPQCKNMWKGPVRIERPEGTYFAELID